MQQATVKKDGLTKIQKLPIIDPKFTSKKYSEKEENHLRQLGDYEFMNLEEPGLMHKFSYGNTGNKKNFTFFHGETYNVPRFIQRHLESKSTPIWGRKPDGTGQMVKILKGRNSRFQMREVYE